MADAKNILWCVENGDLNELRIKLENSKIPIDDPKLTGKRPAIICAADYGQDIIIGCLIEKGSNVNIVDDNGITPLLAAIWEGHVSTVELLLKNGAKHKGLKSPRDETYKNEAEKKEIKDLLDKY